MQSRIQYNKGRNIICCVSDFGFENSVSYGYLFRAGPDVCFEFNVNGGIEELYIAIYPDEVELTPMNGEITIGDKTYYGEEPVDFTNTINNMIDENQVSEQISEITRQQLDEINRKNNENYKKIQEILFFVFVIISGYKNRNSRIIFFQLLYCRNSIR